MPKYEKHVAISGKDGDEIFSIVSKTIDDLLKKASIGKYEIETLEADRIIKFSASLFSAQVRCEDHNVHIEGKLSLMAAPFRSKVDEVIDRWVNKNFG